MKNPTKLEMKAPAVPDVPAAELLDAPLCAGPDPDTHRPRFAVPAGATDCHAHIFGPATKYRYFRQRVYTPPDALLPAYWRMLDTLGVQRAVLVQPSVYEFDNSAMLDAIAASDRPMRGVAVVPESISDAELERMHQSGVRGVRFNICDVKPEQRGKISMEVVRRIARRIKRLGWHVQFLMRVDEFPDLEEMFNDFPTDIVVDHFGYMKPPANIDHPSFQALLALVARGHCWVKISRAYSFGDAKPFARALVAANADRLVWGSDWPHQIGRAHV